MAARAQKRTVVRLSIIAIAVFAFLLARGCAFRPETNHPGSYFNQGENGVWLGVEWVSQLHSADEITALAQNLAQHQIRYVFVYASYLRTDTLDFNPKYDYAADFVSAFKAAEPGIKLLAWFGVPMPSLGGAADLANQTIRQKVVAISGHFVRDLGFDGVHLDPETVASGDQDLIALLDETRSAIGSQTMLSLATPMIQPIFPDQALFGTHIGWSGGYYQQVARHVDQMAVMAYDSRLSTDWLYRELLRFEVINLSHALSRTSAEVLFGIPASAEATVSHNPSVENIGNGLQGLIDGLNDLETVPGVIRGLSIYPAWEMDAAKWSAYESEWQRSK